MQGPALMPDERRPLPARPVAPWVGGKKLLSRRLAGILDRVEHRTYCEVFVGMAGVFLARRRQPPVEVINDASAEVATLFRILQRHYVAFLDMMRFQLTTRAEFERLEAVDPATMTDLERAARFLYLQRTAFGGKVSGRNFGVSAERPGRFNLTTLEPMLEDLHARLAGVVIERLDFEECLRRYDRAETLFYLDPPYWGSEHIYGRELFSRADYERLEAALRVLKGRFVMSINDRPETRAMLAGFEIETAEVTYGISQSVEAKGVRRGELIARNFRI